MLFSIIFNMADPIWPPEYQKIFFEDLGHASSTSILCLSKVLRSNVTSKNKMTFEGSNFKCQIGF